MSTTASGRHAEEAVAKCLYARGYSLLAQNWRTRQCEIDLVMRKAGVIYFIEVKYRASSNLGEGVDYVGTRKLRQMRFAAEQWVSQNNWPGDWRLLVASVDSRLAVTFYEAE